MTITAYSHAKIIDVDAYHSDGTYWVDAKVDGSTLALFISMLNVEGMKAWAAAILETCIAVEKDELARVESEAARHCVAKTNPSPDMITDFGMVEHKTYVPDEDDIPY